MQARALLVAERDENTESKDFTPSEAVALAEGLEPLERKTVKEREGRGGSNSGKARRSENFSNLPHRSRASDKVAFAVGMSRPTLARAKAVVAGN